MPLRSPLRPQVSNTGVSPDIREFLSLRMFLIIAAALIALAVAVYSPVLNFQFILDDHRFTQDHRIQFSGYIWDYFANFVWAQFAGMPPSFYRPIFVLWMRVNFVLCGLSSWGWHFLSIGKHVFVAALLAMLVWNLLRDRAAALLAAALFVLHPAQTESVGWVTVPDPLMAAGVLGSLLLFLKYLRGADTETTKSPHRRRKHSSNERTSRHTPLVLASAVCSLIALFAKETAIILLALIFSIAFIHARSEFLASQKGVRSQAATGIWAFAKPALGETLPFLIATATYLLLRLHALQGSVSSRTQHLGVATILLSWPATLWFYVKVLFWPAHSHAFANPTIVKSFSIQQVLLPAFQLLVVGAALFGMLVWIWKQAGRTSSRKRAESLRTAAIVGSLLLVLPILLTLDLNALNPGDFLHGRYTYLPLAGLMLLIATGWHLSGKMRLPLLLVPLALLITFSTLTWAQEKQWRDDATVFTVAHELAPQNEPVARHLADAHVQQALQLDEAGRCDEAVPIFQDVSRQYPDDWYTWAALGDCMVQLTQFVQAEEDLHRAADISHNPRVIEQWKELRKQMGLPAPDSDTH